MPFWDDWFGSEDETQTARFVDTKEYNPNAGYLGGRQGFAQEEARMQNAMVADADKRGAIQADFGRAYGADTDSAGARADQYAALGAQRDALALQKAAALGQAPSVAQLQLQQGLGQAMANSASLAASARGGPGAQALAARAALQGNAQMAQQAGMQSAQLRAQEMAQARDAYGAGAAGIQNTLGNIRGQDLGRMNTLAGMAQNQAGNALQSRGQNDARALEYERMRQQTLENERQGALAQQRIAQGDLNNYTQMENARRGGNAQRGANFATTAIGAMASGASGGAAGAAGA